MRVLETEEDGVLGAALVEAGPHAVDVCVKPVEAETLLELSILPGRPHGQRSAETPPWAATVWLRVGKTLVMQAVLSPASANPSVARSPAPPAPMTTTS